VEQAGADAVQYPVRGAGVGEGVGPDGGELVAYIPAHRDAAYLTQVLKAVLPGLRFGSAGEVHAAPQQGDIQTAITPDVLVIGGTSADLDRARQLVPVLDRPRPMVSVKAVVMQVTDIKARGSALGVLASIAGGRISAGSFGAEAPGAQFLRLGRGALTAVLSAVREDSRVRIVATPNLAALSGAVATINAGSQVPTVGAVVVAEGGAPVQSVVYRDSGITLTVRPVVRGQLVEMDVSEERSTFVRTTTGLEDTPTLQKSAARASVTLKSGESVVLAGLTEESDGTRREGLLGGLLGVRGRDKSSTELVIILTADVVPSPATPPGHFVDLDPKEEKPA